jgi:hypothetical protein
MRAKEKMGGKAKINNQKPKKKIIIIKRKIRFFAV